VPLTRPERITIVEVAPRDGLQAEDRTLSTDVKLELLERLADAGHTAIEATSFVSPKAVPQLADAEEVMKRLKPRGGVRYTALVPNDTGLERALACGVREIAVFASACESYSQKNLNRSRDEAIAGYGPVIKKAKNAGLRVRGYLSMVVADPWDGPTPAAVVADLSRRLLDFGCDEISLGDTIGVGTPAECVAMIDAVAAKVPREKLAAHFHDTYGQSLANIMAVMERGIAVFDTAVAGLGGCPYAKGASGNVGTEDVIYLMNGLGIEHGVDLEAIAQAGREICVALGREPASKVAQALKAKAA
jgi:isopropylmalate/homocitrate/citramalate synthase